MRSSLCYSCFTSAVDLPGARTRHAGASQDTHNKQHNASRRLDLITVMDVLCHQRSRCYSGSLLNSCSMCVQQAATLLPTAGRLCSAPTTITTQCDEFSFLSPSMPVAFLNGWIKPRMAIQMLYKRKVVRQPEAPTGNRSRNHGIQGRDGSQYKLRHEEAQHIDLRCSRCVSSKIKKDLNGHIWIF